MKKGTKVFEEKFNIKWEDLTGSFNVEDLLNETLNDMSEGSELIVRFIKDEKGNVQVKFRMRNELNINKMGKEALENLLEKHKEELSDLEDEEPDEDDVKAYEKWEYKVEEKEEGISEVKKGLEALVKKEAEHSIDAQILQQKYTEFFNIAKSVLIDNADEKQLIIYLENNKDIKDSIVSICDLIEKEDCVSTSMIQRNARIGYQKAVQIVDGLESIGVSAPFNGLPKRKVVAEQLEKLKTYLI